MNRTYASSPGTDADLDQAVREVTLRVADRLIDEVERDGADAAGNNDTPLALDERRQQLLVGAWISDEITVTNENRLRTGLGPLDLDAEQWVRRRVAAELTGAGPLEPYLNDNSVEEIDVNSASSTWITYADGRKVDIGALWKSTAELTAFQKRLALRMRGTGEGRLDTSSPMLTMQSSDGSRIVMVLGGATEHGISTHPRIAIRRFVVRQAGLDGLADLGLFPHHLVPQLRALVRCGFTMLVSGPPGAGKTTLLTELLGEVSPLERIITVEKNLLELRLEDDPRHPDAPALFTRHSNAEGEGEITTRQLVELTRRLNPDRVVVGELVEDEALDMLDVASMCKRGSLATIHAHTSDIVLQRLAYYVSKSNTNLPEFAVWSLIAQTVDFVVHIDLVRNAAVDQATTRRVTSIVEVGGLGEAGGVSSTEVWGLDGAGDLAQLAPLSARHLNRLRVSGYSPDDFALRGARS
jgi:pilus assembly protein CpaF